jgi:hypothetical protein
MGKINLTALRVRQTALNQFAAGKIKKLPQWVEVVGDIPPAEALIRNRTPQHQLVRQRLQTSPDSSKPSSRFKKSAASRRSPVVNSSQSNFDTRKINCERISSVIILGSLPGLVWFWKAPAKTLSFMIGAGSSNLEGN